MAIVNIAEKCIVIAREMARKNSSARWTGRSVFIKRYYGTYRLLAVDVTAKQRGCRNLFAEAQKMASAELKHWEKRRYWARQARVHNVKGAHRMAVSHFYRLLKRGGVVADILAEEKEEKMKVVCGYMVLSYPKMNIDFGSGMLRNDLCRRRGDWEFFCASERPLAA